MNGDVGAVVPVVYSAKNSTVLPLRATLAYVRATFATPEATTAFRFLMPISSHLPGAYLFAVPVFLAQRIAPLVMAVSV